MYLARAREAVFFFYSLARRASIGNALRPAHARLLEVAMGYVEKIVRWRGTTADGISSASEVLLSCQYVPRSCVD